MGKRKKIDDRVGTPPPPPPPPLAPDSMPSTFGVESSSRKRFLHSTDFKVYKPFSPSSSVMDSSLDRVITRSSPTHHRRNLSRSMLLKRSRNRQGHHYWRNSSGVHLNPSTSYGKVTPSWEEKLSFKLDSRQKSDHPHFTVVDSDRSFVRPERIRSSSFLLDADSLYMAKLPCPICSKWLRRKPYVLASSHSGEHDVAAVLVCGHIYHADCLEQETPTENKSDPPCPACLGFLLNAAVEV